MAIKMYGVKVYGAREEDDSRIFYVIKSNKCVMAVPDRDSLKGYLEKCGIGSERVVLVGKENLEEIPAFWRERSVRESDKIDNSGLENLAQ
jgi:hypothetical protein